jgi:hypothetical protein
MMTAWNTISISFLNSVRKLFCSFPVTKYNSFSCLRFRPCDCYGVLNVIRVYRTHVTKTRPQQHQCHFRHPWQKKRTKIGLIILIKVQKLGVFYRVYNWDEILRFKTNKLINSNWNKEELSDQLKESIIVPDYKKGDKTGYSNYRGILMLLTSYKILSNIFLSRLSSYIDEIIGDHLWVLTYQINCRSDFCICQIRGSVVVKALCCKPEGRGFKSRWGGFFKLT